MGTRDRLLSPIVCAEELTYVRFLGRTLAWACTQSRMGGTLPVLIVRPTAKMASLKLC
jgi:hypothetical protein